MGIYKDKIVEIYDKVNQIRGNGINSYEEIGVTEERLKGYKEELSKIENGIYNYEDELKGNINKKDKDDMVKECINSGGLKGTKKEQLLIKLGYNNSYQVITSLIIKTIYYILISYIVYMELRGVGLTQYKGVGVLSSIIGQSIIIVVVLLGLGLLTLLMYMVMSNVLQKVLSKAEKRVKDTNKKRCIKEVRDAINEEMLLEYIIGKIARAKITKQGYIEKYYKEDIIEKEEEIKIKIDNNEKDKEALELLKGKVKEVENYIKKVKDDVTKLVQEGDKVI